jgi:hypothetical protein
MGIDRPAPAQSRAPQPLSGRARAALQQHQRRVSLLEKDMLGADRMLAGALSACDAPSQLEMLGQYLETVQELRVSLQRLEAFLLQRLTEPTPPAHGAGNGSATRSGSGNGSACVTEIGNGNGHGAPSAVPQPYVTSAATQQSSHE